MKEVFVSCLCSYLQSTFLITGPFMLCMCKKKRIAFQVSVYRMNTFECFDPQTLHLKLCNSSLRCDVSKKKTMSITLKKTTMQSAAVKEFHVGESAQHGAESETNHTPETSIQRIQREEYIFPQSCYLGLTHILAKSSAIEELN